MRHFSAEELLARLKNFVAEERRITIVMIEHLREVERRLLFSELGYGSLFEFCTRELGLSEGSAQRRIQAMRLLKAVPEAKPALESGRLSLSNAARVQSFFQLEKKQGRATQHAEKLEVSKQVEDLSQRACEQKLFAISPQSVPQERIRVIAEDRRELQLVISEEFYKKLELLKGLLAHAKPEASYAELFELLADQALKQFEKRKGITFLLSPHSEGESAKAAQSAMAEQNFSVHTAAAVGEGIASCAAPGKSRGEVPQAARTWSTVETLLPPPISTKTGNPKVAPPGIRSHHARLMERAVWQKAQGRCQFEHEGRRCNSRYRLEIDHQLALARGGSNAASNLRLLCRVHNVHQTVAVGVA